MQGKGRLLGTDNTTDMSTGVCLGRQGGSHCTSPVGGRGAVFSLSLCSKSLQPAAADHAVGVKKQPVVEWSSLSGLAVRVLS